MMDATELAKQALATLNKQQAYFKAARDTPEKERLLRESKTLERDLREACDEVLRPAKTPSLFEDDEARDKSRPYWTR